MSVIGVGSYFVAKRSVGGKKNELLFATKLKSIMISINNTFKISKFFKSGYYVILFTD